MIAYFLFYFLIFNFNFTQANPMSKLLTKNSISLNGISLFEEERENIKFSIDATNLKFKISLLINFFFIIFFIINISKKKGFQQRIHQNNRKSQIRNKKRAYETHFDYYRTQIQESICAIDRQRKEIIRLNYENNQLKDKLENTKNLMNENISKLNNHMRNSVTLQYNSLQHQNRQKIHHC